MAAHAPPTSLAVVGFCSTLAAALCLLLLVLLATRSAVPLSQYSRLQAVDIASRVVSTAHALLVSFMALRSFYEDWALHAGDVQDAVFGLTPARQGLLSCSLAYFVLDVGVLIMYWLDWAATSANHSRLARLILASEAGLYRSWLSFRAASFFSNGSSAHIRRHRATVAAFRRQHQHPSQFKGSAAASLPAKTSIIGSLFTLGKDTTVSTDTTTSLLSQRLRYNQHIDPIHKDKSSNTISSLQTHSQDANTETKVVTSGMYLTTMTLHHAAIISAFSLSLYYAFAAKYMCLLMLNELSTPFLNLRALIHHFQVPIAKYSLSLFRRARLTNLIALGVSFFMTRVVLNAFALGHVIWVCNSAWSTSIEFGMKPHIAVIGIILLALHNVLNLLWFARLTRTAISAMFDNNNKNSISSKSTTITAAIDQPVPFIKINNNSTDVLLSAHGQPEE